MDSDISPDTSRIPSDSEAPVDEFQPAPCDKMSAENYPSSFDAPASSCASPDDDYLKADLPRTENPIEVSSVEDRESVLAEATRDDERRHSTPDMTFVSLVRQVSVESLMDMARPYFDLQRAQPFHPGDIKDSNAFGPVVENYYDLFDRKLDDTTIKTLSQPELETAIDTLKDKIMSYPPDKSQTERTAMVQQLILLRLKLQEIEDFNPKSPGITSLGHHFIHRGFRHLSKRGKYCEVCGQLMIFAPSQFDCTSCGFSCHERCISSIARACVADQIQQTLNPTYVMDICPEKGLDSQNFSCAECRKLFPMEKSDIWESQTIRLCDYNGKYYCGICHRNDMAISPARAVKNWDLGPRPVSRESKQILQILASHAILNLQELNKDLSAQVEGIAQVQDIRARLAILQRLMLDCENGPQIALLHKLPTGRKHFLTKNCSYSLNDLIDIEKGVLVKELADFADQLEGHCRVTCSSCVLCAQLCATCKKDGDRLFPFEGRVTFCASCGATMHKSCFAVDSFCVACRRKTCK